MDHELKKQKKISVMKDTIITAFLLAVAVIYMIQSNLKVREPWETDLLQCVFVVPVCVYLLSFLADRWLFFFTIREVNPKSMNVLRKTAIVIGIVYILLWIWILAAGMMHFGGMLTEHSFADQAFLHAMKYMSSMPNRCVLLFLGIVTALVRS